jgi:hypothetical protein
MRSIKYPSDLETGISVSFYDTVTITRNVQEMKEKDFR